MAVVYGPTMRRLGDSGLEVGPLTFGGNIFGWTADESTSFRLLDAFVDSGMNLVDTANVYSKWAPGNRGGESETIIGKWFRQTGKRDRVVLATKVGMEMSSDETGLSRAAILRSVEDSLRRLQTDHIDLYQSHKDDPNTPLKETLEAFDTLIRQGKVRAIGASNYSADRLGEALRISRESGLPAYHALQPEYNLCERAKFEEKLEPLCLEAGIGVIPYYSLCSGFLTGKYRSEADLTKSPRGAKVKSYLNDRGFAILAALDEVAERHASTPGRVAIAWMLARPSITSPIASATSIEQLEDLIEATRFKLDDDDIQALNQASAWA